MDKANVIVIDTNCIIDNPRIVYGFTDSLIVIPEVVIEELDNLKNRDGVRRQSRAASWILDELTEKLEELGDSDIPLDNGCALRFDRAKELIFPVDKPDYQIISLAIGYAKQPATSSVTLYSNDTNVRIAARTAAAGLELSQKFKAKKYSVIDKSLHEIESGIQDLVITDAEMSFFRDKGYLNATLEQMNGEHILLHAESNPEMNCAAGIWDRNMQKILPIHDYKKGEAVWMIGGGKSGSSPVKPKDLRQNFLMNDLMDVEKNLHFVLSRVAGAGKNFVTTACILRLLRMGYYDRFIMVKPMISKHDIGYLPGDKGEKMAPWFESFQDTMFELTNGGQSSVQDLEAKIELDIVTHMRGRSIPRTVMVIDECQNFSEEEVKTLLTRAGVDAKYILMGDLSQIDNPRLDSSNNGLRVWSERARNKESGYENSTYILLDNNFRSELSGWASSFYE